MYWESHEKAQSHTHFPIFCSSVFVRLKSAADQILQVPSAEVVARRLQGGGVMDGMGRRPTYVESGLKRHFKAYLVCALSFVRGVRVMGLVPIPLERLHT